MEALLRKWLSGPGFLTGSREVKGEDILRKKSRCMVFIGDGNSTPRLDIRVDGKKMAQVGEFCYLGTIISADGTCSATIDDRIRKAWFRIHTQVITFGTCEDLHGKREPHSSDASCSPHFFMDVNVGPPAKQT